MRSIQGTKTRTVLMVRATCLITRRRAAESEGEISLATELVYRVPKATWNVPRQCEIPPAAQLDQSRAEELSLNPSQYAQSR